MKILAFLYIKVYRFLGGLISKSINNYTFFYLKSIIILAQRRIKFIWLRGYINITDGLKVVSVYIVPECIDANCSIK